MTREEAKDYIREWCPYDRQEEIIKALEQEPCEDAISREEALQALCKAVHKNDDTIPCSNQRVSCLWSKTKVQDYAEEILELPSVAPKEKTGHCKDCKWWKDNDGVYRRGIGAESKCPINCKKVYEGNGYCFMFEPQESEVSK